VYVCVQVCVIWMYVSVCARTWTGRDAGVTLLCMYMRESARERERETEREIERERDAGVTRDTLGEKSTKILD
jgi:hypothetical protein